ncbi:MAG: HAD-IA family hydrolase [Candidatus Moduliflexus flocculans]|nr:HAD-IA family hydrolase [Candidatus Moduliflexus flocculans]
MAAELGLDGLPLEQDQRLLPRGAGRPAHAAARGPGNGPRAGREAYPAGPRDQRHRRRAEPALRRLARHPHISGPSSSRRKLGFAKPDPRIFGPALRETGAAADEVLYVGDSVTSDMAAARNAGMDFCWLNPGDSPVPDGFAPILVLASIRDLPGRLGL